MTEIYITDFFDNNIDNKKYISLIKKIVNVDINYNKDQTLISWMMLMMILDKNIDKPNILFKKNEYGKPFLFRNELFFNISHSETKVVVAISDKEVGVDIEKISNPNLRIVDRYFAECEKEYIFLKNNRVDNIRRFYIIWTLKESYLKFKGVGLKEKLNSFSINCLEGKKIRLISDEDIFCNLHYTEIDNYILSCCSLDKNIKVRNIDVQKILNYYG